MLCSKQSCAQLPPAENIRFCCPVLHPGKQSMDNFHLEKLSCPVCWEKNPYFDTEAKYQKLFIQLALAMSSASVSFQDLVKICVPLYPQKLAPVLGCTFASECVVDKKCIFACQRPCPVTPGRIQMLQKTQST